MDFVGEQAEKLKSLEMKETQNISLDLAYTHFKRIVKTMNMKMTRPDPDPQTEMAVSNNITSRVSCDISLIYYKN